MPSYRVGFFNEFARGARLHKVCQRSIVIRCASSAEEAAEAAKRRFAQLEGIRDWRIHAAMIEIEPILHHSHPDTGADMREQPSAGCQSFGYPE